MQYLRKIDIRRWYGQPEGDSDSVSDLGTYNHELSVWEVDDDGSNLDDMALALALIRNTPEQICCILLRPDEITDPYGWKVEVSSQDGITGYEKMKSRHKNFMLFTISEMGKLASYIHRIIRDEEEARIKVYTEQDLLKMLADKITASEIDAEDLKDKHGKWRKEALKIIAADKVSAQ